MSRKENNQALVDWQSLIDLAKSMDKDIQSRLVRDWKKFAEKVIALDGALPAELMQDWMNIYSLLNEMDKTVRGVLIRDRFTPGTKVKKRGELGKTEGTKIGMDGTPPPHYNDPTGDSAIWSEEIRDTTHVDIRGLWQTIRNAHNTLTRLNDLSNTDPKKRAERTLPDCLACGEQILGRNRGGFCSRCHAVWLRAERPDRVLFVTAVKARITKELGPQE